MTRSHAADAPAAAAPEPCAGVLVVGMGDETRGDGGVGLHLMQCLAQLDWPESICFCAAGEQVPALAGQFARVILLDAMEGPESPGALYEADPEEMLAASVGGLGLLGMLPRPVLKRLSVFGVQPATTAWGDPLSVEVIASMPVILPYLRACILRAASETQYVN